MEQNRSFVVLLEAELFTDCLLVAADGQKARAHRSYLSAVSPFLKMLLKDQENFEGQTVINLIDFLYEDIISFINFIYTGHLLLKIEESEKFMELIAFLEININVQSPESELASSIPHGMVRLNSDYLSGISKVSRNIEASNEYANLTDVESEEKMEAILPLAEVAPVPVVTSVSSETFDLASVMDHSMVSQNIKYALVPNKPAASLPIYLLEHLPSNMNKIVSVEDPEGSIKQSAEVHGENSANTSFLNCAGNSLPRRTKRLSNGQTDMNKGTKKLRNTPDTTDILKSLESENEYHGIIKRKPQQSNQQGSMIIHDQPFHESYFMDVKRESTEDNPDWGFETDTQSDAEEEKDITYFPEGKQVVCPRCKGSFPHAGFYKHKRVCPSRRSAAGTFKCPACPKLYSCKVTVQRHVKAVHGEEVLKDIPTVEKRRINELVCELCGFITTKNEAFKDHMNYHTGDRPYLCEICSNTFLSKCALITHRQHAHPKTPLELICNLCGLTFYSNSTYRCHVKRHENDPKYKPVVTGEFICSVCNKKFPSRLSIKLHTQRMHRDGNASNDHNLCRVCKETFDSKFSLQQHMHGHRKFECDYCHKKFITEWSRTTHQKMLRCTVIAEQIKNGIPFEREMPIRRNVKCKVCEDCFSSAEYREHKKGECPGAPNPNPAHPPQRRKKNKKGATHPLWVDVSKQEYVEESIVEPDLPEQLADEVYFDQVDGDLVEADQEVFVSI